MTRVEAMVPAKRCAADSMPPLRLKVLGDVVKHPGTRTADVVKRLQLPRKTVDRVLQELHLLGLLVVDDEKYGDSVRWIYSLAGDVNATALAELTNPARNVTTHDGEDSAPRNSQPNEPPGEPVVRDGPRPTPLRTQLTDDIHTCVHCGAPLLFARETPGRTTCERCRLARQAAS